MELDLENRCKFEHRVNNHLAKCEDKGYCPYVTYFLNVRYCRRYHDQQHQIELTQKNLYQDDKTKQKTTETN
jgi:hypothetical protein